MTTTDDDDATPTRRSRAQMREAIVPHSKVYVRGLRVSVRADAFMYVCTMRSRLDSIAAERRSRATSAARRGVSRRATASESSKRARLVTDLSLFSTHRQLEREGDRPQDHRYRPHALLEDLAQKI
jgi:hypothetical protein